MTHTGTWTIHGLYDIVMAECHFYALDFVFLCSEYVAVDGMVNNADNCPRHIDYSLSFDEIIACDESQ